MMARIHALIVCALPVLVILGQGDCGRVRRVVGGRRLDMWAWPWLVSLNFKEHHDYLVLQGLDHLCGGSLIHPQWVLTAAHCVHNGSGPGLAEPSNWVAVLGEYNRMVNEESEQKIDVEGIYINPLYTLLPNLTGDIALLKLREPARNTTAVRPVALDFDRRIAPGTVCEAAGWGQHTADEYGQPQFGNGTMVPHVISVKMESQTMCGNAYRNEWPLVDASVLCFYSDQKKDTCQGDSGGPLMCHDVNGNHVLTGLVSVGVSCAHEQFPGIYTRVSHYANWIWEVIDTYSTTPPAASRQDFLNNV